MQKRLPDYHGRYPLWAYPDNKPDLRQRQFGAKGISGVRIEFIASSDDILISDFGAWHAVLNGHYLSLDEQDDEAFYEGNQLSSVWIHDNRDMQAGHLIIESWERIFDLEALRKHPEWYGYGQLQATLSQITTEQVVQVKPFVSK